MDDHRNAHVRVRSGQGEEISPFTQDIMDAIIDVVKVPTP